MSIGTNNWHRMPLNFLVGLMVGRDNPEGLFQTKWLYYLALSFLQKMPKFWPVDKRGLV